MKFSTKDNDNENKLDGPCAVIFKGAWRFNSCHESHLNAPYHHTGNVTKWSGIAWYEWKGRYYSLKFTEMKVRRN